MMIGKHSVQIYHDIQLIFFESEVKSPKAKTSRIRTPSQIANSFRSNRTTDSMIAPRFDRPTIAATLRSSQGNKAEVNEVETTKPAAHRAATPNSEGLRSRVSAMLGRRGRSTPSIDESNATPTPVNASVNTRASRVGSASQASIQSSRRNIPSMLTRRSRANVSIDKTEVTNFAAPGPISTSANPAGNPVVRAANSQASRVGIPVPSPAARRAKRAPTPVTRSVAARPATPLAMPVAAPADEAAINEHVAERFEAGLVQVTLALERLAAVAHTIASPNELPQLHARVAILLRLVTSLNDSRVARLQAISHLEALGVIEVQELSRVLTQIDNITNGR